MKLPRIIIGLLALGALAAHGIETGSPEQKLVQLGHPLPPTPKAIANYVPAVRTGNLVFLAGQIPRGDNGEYQSGKVGRDLTEAQGAEAARRCAVQLLAALKAEIGDLSKVKRIVRVGGFVNCTPEFTAQSKVVNGASDLFVAVFGDAGRHARASVGVASLPGNAPVEIELVAEVAE